jgi:hypothetical protein
MQDWTAELGGFTERGDARMGGSAAGILLLWDLLVLISAQQDDRETFAL